MKKMLKSMAALFLANLMVFGAAPLSGFAGLDIRWPDLFDVKASAFSEGIYTYTVSDGKATITGCDSPISGAISIPTTLGDYPVTSIGDWAFYQCEHLTSVTIPSGVTSIGLEAFFFCDGLTSIIIPDSVVNIGSRAFYGTAWYNNQPDGLVYAGKVAYKYKGSMPAGTSIILEQDTKGIAGIAFFFCQNMTSVTIPGSVLSIGDEAFCICDGLTSVDIPGSVTSIGNEAFNSCSVLTNITVANSNNDYSSEDGILFNKAKSFLIQCPGGKTGAYSIPSSVTNIGDWAFSWCEYLTSVTIPNSVTSIGESAFEGCSELMSVTIPPTVTVIGSNAYKYCSELTIFGIQGTYAQIYANTNAIPFTAIFSPVMGSSSVINSETGFIAGLEPGITKELLEISFVTVGAGYTLEYSTETLGTGTMVSVVSTGAKAAGGTIIASFTIVIFGDVNGDGNIDTGDAGLIVDYENFMLDWDPSADVALFEAADLNGDGNVDTADAGLIVDVENFLLEVDQTTGLAS